MATFGKDLPPKWQKQLQTCRSGFCPLGPTAETVLLKRDFLLYKPPDRRLFSKSSSEMCKSCAKHFRSTLAGCTKFNIGSLIGLKAASTSQKLHTSDITLWGCTLSAGGAEIYDRRSNHCWEESIRRYAALSEFDEDPVKLIGSFGSHVPQDDIEYRELRYDLLISTGRIILLRFQWGDTSLRSRYRRGHGRNCPWQPISRKHYFPWGQIGKCRMGKEEQECHQACWEEPIKMRLYGHEAVRLPPEQTCAAVEGVRAYTGR
ncbi:hypothetical protein FB451DRAFT_1168333 [Mycena latifolia]|nr:hypothetical protein FB451DRAFT_1168333 [Mycena latifolia]